MRRKYPNRARISRQQLLWFCCCFVSRKSSVFLNAVNHPSLLSPEERVPYRSRASQKLKAMAASEVTTLYTKLDDK
ncbi:unnamed protein product [Prunus armeniaca]|uniref:Uncharacterized protein n=1 Tax=Prunus armeniaca TaxID=36596 RepID=A0A6J5XFQ6_PRUAR|nr:unnamed protein product [Prunus armeniaca]